MLPELVIVFATKYVPKLIDRKSVQAELQLTTLEKRKHWNYRLKTDRPNGNFHRPFEPTGFGYIWQCQFDKKIELTESEYKDPKKSRGVFRRRMTTKLRNLRRRAGKKTD